MSRYDAAAVTPIWDSQNTPTGKYEVACNCGPIAIAETLDEGLAIASAHDAASHPFAEADWDEYFAD